MFFISTVEERHAVAQMKKILIIFNFSDSKFFELAEISGVGRAAVEKQISKDGQNQSFGS